MAVQPPATNDQMPPVAPPEDGGGLDARELGRTLWRYKWLVLGVTVVVGTGVILWTLRQPKVYQATTTVEYDPHPTSPLGSEVEDVATPGGSFLMSREFFATQNRIISSRAVAERVVRELGLHRDPSFFYLDSFANASEQQAVHVRLWRWVSSWFSEPAREPPPTGPSVEATAQVLQSRLTVEPIRDTRIVAIRVTDRDPARAATLANAVADAYIAKTLEDRMGSTVNALEWLGNQLDTLRDQLDTSELALHRFKEEHNILSVSMEDRQNLVASDIEHFNEALTKARTRRIELQARAARIRSIAEADTPEDSASAFPDNATIAGLREQLRQKIAEREGLSSRYGARHQRMEQLDQEIAELRRNLREELEGVVRAAQADVREISQIESALRSALDDAHRSGLEVNLREIEYRRLNRERENNAKLYNLVLERTTETDLTRMLRTTHARPLERALEPNSPVSPNLTTNASAGLGGGLVLGLALAFLLGRLDRRLKSVADVEGLGLTILGILPRIEEGEEAQPTYAARRRKRPDRRRPGTKAPAVRDLYVHSHPMSAVAECCRTIRTNLTFMSADDPIRSLVVTSASPREGKTTVTTNIAISLAQSGKRVLLVDTDLRRPRIHRAFGVPGSRGVTSVVVGEARLQDIAIATDIPNLDVLPSGAIPPNPSELLHSQRFTQLIEKALENYDRVIFDSPPLGAVTDAAVLAPQVDAALIVVKAERTTRDALASALRQLSDVGATVAGGVLNDLEPRRKGYGAGEYYYYYRQDAYYQSHDVDDDGSDERGAAAPPPM